MLRDKQNKKFSRILCEWINFEWGCDRNKENNSFSFYCWLQLPVTKLLDFELIPEILTKRMLRDVPSNKVRNLQEFFANEWILNEGVTGTKKLIVSHFAVDCHYQWPNYLILSLYLRFWQKECLEMFCQIKEEIFKNSLWMNEFWMSLWQEQRN